MKFEIGFNKFNDPKDTIEFYKHIGATQPFIEEHDYYEWFIEIKNFKQLEKLSKKINLYLTDNKNDFEYSLIISFDPNVIYLDKDV